ncbi:MAG: glycosyltransferase [Bacillota bacterium]
MKTKKIIITIEFNSRSDNHDDYKIGLTPEWINYRMSIFMQYTLKSLINQTNQNFITLIQYAESTEKLIKQALAIYEPLPDNVQFVPHKSHNDQIKEQISGYQYLYLVRLDCDDTYHKTFIQQLIDYQPKKSTQALINQNGYVYDSINNRIAPFRHFSPPFYTLIYKTQDFINGKRYKFNGHGKVITLKYEILTKNKKRNFLIVIHRRNTLNQKLLKRTKFESNCLKVLKIVKKFI